MSVTQIPLFDKPKERRGALFTIETGIDLSIVETYYEWSHENRTPSGCIDFVHALIEACTDNPERLTDIHEMEEILGKSRSSLLQRCSALVEMGLMEKTWRKIEGRRKVSLFTLKDCRKISPPPNVFNNPQPETLTASSEQPTQLSNDFLYANKPNQFSVKGEIFSVFTLVAALPSGKSGELRETLYSCPIRVGKEVIHLEVRPTYGTKVASVLDLRVLAAVITLVYRQAEQGRPAVNPFIFDFDDLYELLNKGKKKSGSYKLYLLSALERWEATGFQIKYASDGIHEKYKGKIEFKELFRYITKLKVLSHIGPKGKTPSKVAISLDEELLRRVTDQDARFLLAIHEQALSENNPFAFRFNLWCRRAVQHHHNPRTWNINWLHAEIEPKRRRDKFKYDLLELCNVKFDDTAGYSKYLGYCFKRETKDALLIWADPEDRLVGVNSHRAFLRKNTKVK